MRINKLIEEARTNEGKLRRMQDMELGFLGAETLEDLCKVIVHDYRAAFGLQLVNLFLFDWDGELSRFLDDVEMAAGDGVSVVSAETADQLLAVSRQNPWLGAYNSKYHSKHVMAATGEFASLAILPLMRQQRRIGMLVLASDEPKRFRPELGTDFLKRLSVIIAACIENALNIERIRQLGLRDPLTQLYNRRYFLERMQQAMELGTRSGLPISCIYADVDFFKRINDELGHPAGDAVLVEVAQCMRMQLRRGEILARIGGEEFAIMLVDADLERARQVAERIRKSLAETEIDVGDGQTAQVTLSSGVAVWLPDQSQASIKAVDDLMARADKALLTAKRTGRNQVVVSD